MVRCLLIITLALAGQAVQAEQFTVSVDRQELTVDEHLVLTFRLQNSNTRLRAEGLQPNLDLSPLHRDFDLGQPQNTYQYRRLPGQFRSTSTITVTLFPKKAGTFTIPAFTVAGHRSEPLDISVRPSSYSAAPLVFVRAGAFNDTVWQRQQLGVFLDVYHRIPLKEAKLGDELVVSPTPLELFEYRRLAIQHRQETFRGFTYKVMRTVWALFPEQPGTLRFRFPETWVITADGRKLHQPHQFVTVDVKPLPPTVPADAIVGSVQLRQSPPQVNAVAGQAITWQVTLTATSLRRSLPSTLPWPSSRQANIYVGPGRHDIEEHLQGYRQTLVYDVAVIPLRGDPLQLPDVTLPFFDPASGQMRQARLPGLRLPVIGSLPPPPSAVPAAPAPQTAGAAQATAFWQGLAIASTVLWLVTLVVIAGWRRAQRRRTAASPEHHSDRQSKRPLESRLLTALNSRSLTEGLAAWEQRHGSDNTLRQAVEAVQRYYYSPQCELDETQVAQLVTAAENHCRTAPACSQPPDIWDPRSLTPAGQFRAFRQRAAPK